VFKGPTYKGRGGAGGEGEGLEEVERGLKGIGKRRLRSI